MQVNLPLKNVLLNPSSGAALARRQQQMDQTAEEEQKLVQK